MVRITLGAGALVALICACTPQKYSANPQDAKGETPIRFVICGGTAGCFISARFNSMDSCESHKKWSEMACETRLASGEMVCKEDTNPIATAYCTL